MNEKPVACSLEAGELENRLAEIASVGAALRSHHEEAAKHVLRFSAGAQTQRRLEAIVAAEAECCPFLDFHLEQEGEQLVLAIVAPAEAAALAAALAERFFSR